MNNDLEQNSARDLRNKGVINEKTAANLAEIKVKILTSILY